MNQVLEPVGYHVQRRCIDRAFVAALGFFAFGLEDIVDFILDFRQRGFRVDAPYLTRQTLE